MIGSAWFAMLAVFVTVAAAAYYAGMAVLRAQTAERVASLRRNREQILEIGFGERVVGPAIRRLGRMARAYTPAGWTDRVQRRLALAGLADRLDVNTWAAIKVISVVVLIVAWLAFQTLLSPWQKIVTLPLFAFAGVFLPDGLLDRRIASRREDMRRQLPDILDLLVISVEAGLGFEAALARVVAAVPGEMSEEFGRMLAETRVGVSRADAMRHLAERTDLDELDSFLLAMMQAETFGVSVSRVLRVQAEEMRVQRRQRAQERAFAAPVKMVFPLVICILPALFVVLLGPAAIQIFRALD